MIRTTTLLLAMTLFAAKVTIAGGGQPAPQTNTAAPTIEDVAWIAGHWRGTGMGGAFEETWNEPFAGSIMGMFKFVKDGEISFYEFLTIVPQGESLAIRLKHFDAALVGWEAKEDSVVFPLQKVTPDEAIFEGLRFHRVNDETMHIVVNINEGDNVEEVQFICKRVPPR